MRLDGADVARFRLAVDKGNKGWKGWKSIVMASELNTFRRFVWSQNACMSESSGVECVGGRRHGGVGRSFYGDSP
jgi:hypothetical protein